MTTTSHKILSSKISLPIHIDETVLEKNPKCGQLLHILANKLTSDGITTTKKKEVDKAEKLLELSKQGWLASQIPYHELREMITEMEISHLEGNLSLHLEQLASVLSDAVIFSEIPDYLPLPSNSVESHNVLGIDLESLDTHNHTKQHLAAVQKVVLPMLEERLINKCRKLHQFFTTHKDIGSPCSPKELLDLSLRVEEAKQQVTRDKANLLKLQEKKRESFLLYYQTLLESLSCMERMILYHKLEVHAVSDKVLVEWMEAWCLACVTKAKLTILQLDCDTYNSKTVGALKIIKGHLDKSIRDAQKELNSVIQQVTAYRAVGTEFKTLVEHYTTLKKEIYDIKWGLQQFSTDGAS